MYFAIELLENIGDKETITIYHSSECLEIEPDTFLEEKRSFINDIMNELNPYDIDSIKNEQGIILKIQDEEIRIEVLSIYEFATKEELKDFLFEYTLWV